MGFDSDASCGASQKVSAKGQSMQRARAESLEASISVRCCLTVAFDAPSPPFPFPANPDYPRSIPLAETSRARKRALGKHTLCQYGHKFGNKRVSQGEGEQEGNTLNTNTRPLFMALGYEFEFSLILHRFQPPDKLPSKPGRTPTLFP